MSGLTNKVALVTGASKGIGAAIAKALAYAGASVVVNYASSREGAETVVAEIRKAGGKAVAIGGSVSKSAEVEKLFSEAEAAFGHVDVVVNNAGVYAFSAIDDVDEESFHRHFDTNVLGLLLVTKAAVKRFGDKGGSIINISSAVTDLLPPQSAIYTGTKGAVDAITGVLAKELGPRKIRVNAINPGLVTTEGTTSLNFVGGEMEQAMVAQTPLGRVGRPDDIADVAVFLASDAARWVTGETLNAAGGLR